MESNEIVNTARNLVERTDPHFVVGLGAIALLFLIEKGRELCVRNGERELKIAAM